MECCRIHSLHGDNNQRQTITKGASPTTVSHSRMGSPVPVAVTTENLQRQNAELALENARLTEAIAARDAFIAVAAHELRNPMTPIVGRVSMLRRWVVAGRLEPDKIGFRR